MLEKNSTFHLLGCSNSFYKKWNLHQLYGEMTEEIYGFIWQRDHCYPLSKINLSNEQAILKSSDWINLKPMYFSENYKPERYNENLLRSTKLTPNENDQVMKELNLIQ